MRRRAGRRFGLAVAAVCATLAPRGASAQFGPFGGTGAPSPGATASQSANPATNPMINPFLNPYMAMFAQGNSANANANANAQNAAMFFLAAQSASGGLGSGQLSGVRPGPGTPRAAGRAARAAQGGPVAVRSSDIPGGGAARYFGSAAIARPEQEAPGPVRTSDIPGGGAARYFGLTTQPNAAASTYYNRSGRYYSTRGH